MTRPYIKIAEEPADDAMVIHIAADPTTLNELQTIILIEANQKGIPYVPQNAEV